MRNIKWIPFVVVLILGIKWHSFAQDIIIQPPVFGPFDCTEFYKLYTGSVSNFTGKEIRGQVLLQVDYTNPSGRTFRLAEGKLNGNPAVVFNPGLTIIDNATLERVYPVRTVTFLDKSIEALISRTKCLPPGEYNVCLSLFEEGSIDGNKPFLTQTCYVREVASLSPLLLVSPFDGDEIVTMLPLFSWTAVTPVIPEARYQIQMVELLANQTAVHAFRANPLFFSKGGLISNIMQYPVSDRALNPCSEYAWRVVYTLDEGVGGNDFLRRPNFLQESEIWGFKTPCQQVEEDAKKKSFSFDTPVYFDVKNSDEGSYHELNDDFLRFIYSYPYKNQSDLKYDILDEKGNSVINNEPVYQETTNNQLPDLPLDCYYGENKFVMELPNSIVQDKFYTLVILNSGVKHFLRFKKKS